MATHGSNISTKLTVRDALPDDADDWQVYVESHPASGILHLPGWRNVLRDAFNVEPVFLIASRGGKICGVVPGYFSSSFIFGKVVETLSGGIIADEADVSNELALQFIERAKNRGAGNVFIWGFVHSPAISRTASVEPHVHSVIHPLGDKEPLWRRLTSNDRRKIRKGHKNGFVFRTAERIPEEFYGIFSSNQHRLGTPVLPKAFFQSINTHLSRNLMFGGVYREGELAAGAVLLEIAGRWESLYVASRRDALRDYANYVLYWGFISAVADAGGKMLDLGRSVMSGGNHRFKQKWLANDVYVPYYSLSTTKGPHPAPRSRSRHKQEFLSSVWKRLPSPVANTLGPLIRRGKPFG